MPDDARKSSSYTPDAETRPSAKRLPSSHGPGQAGEDPGVGERADEAKSETPQPSEAGSGGDAAAPKAEKRRSESGGKEKPAGGKEKPAGGQDEPAAKAGAKRLSSDEEAYEKVKKHLRDLVAKKAGIDRDLEDIEERLYVEEGAYLQDASAGNVAKGFEHYTKGSQNRRKSLLGDGDRVFSQSSTSFDAES